MDSRSEAKPFEISSQLGIASGVPHVTSRGEGLLALAVMTCIVVVFQCMQGLNADTSWLLTVGDRWLAGAVPYRDILETNPPMSVLIFWPAVLVSHLTTIAAEPIVIVSVAVLGFAIIEMTVGMLMTADCCSSPPRMRLALGFMVLIMPMSTYAERENIAVMVLLPTWGAMAIRATGKPLKGWAMILAGIGAGLAMCIKPQFAAAVLLPALVVARAQRRFVAILQPEYCIAGALVVIYAVVLIVAFPNYFDVMMPLLGDLYRPVREPIGVIVSAESLRWVLLALAGLWLMAGEKIKTPQIAIPLLASLGFAFALVEQSKGWAYHYYPVAASLVPALLDTGFGIAGIRIAAATRSARLVIVLGFLATATGLMFAALTFLGVNRPMQTIVAPITTLHPHPKMVAITPHLWVGHPLTRDLGGSWIGSVPNAWMTLGALYTLGRRPPVEPERHRLEAVIASDRARMARDIAAGKPDIVIVEHDDRVFPAWFGSDAELVEFLKGYSRASVEFGILDLWVRNR